MNVAPTYFADTSFWIALLEAGDQHHARAIAWQRNVVTSHAFVITTEAVLWEVLNYFAIPAARTRAARLYHVCRDRQEIGIEGFRPDLTEAALQLYESRADKSWGITDCLSFEIMRMRNVKQALTADHHFQQAGYEALLLRDP